MGFWHFGEGFWHFDEGFWHFDEGWPSFRQIWWVGELIGDPGGELVNPLSSGPSKEKMIQMFIELRTQQGRDDIQVFIELRTQQGRDDIQMFNVSNVQ